MVLVGGSCSRSRLRGQTHTSADSFVIVVNDNNVGTNAGQQGCNLTKANLRIALSHEFEQAIRFKLMKAIGNAVSQER